MTMEVNYNVFLVVLSFVVSVFGSFTGLQVTNGMYKAKSGLSVGWLVAAAFALGGGAIWTMHFIGMLAYQVPVDVSYEPGLTFVSLLIAVVAVGVGVAIVVTGKMTTVRLLSAGVFTGLAVASMHYVGMAAMVMPGDMTYDQTLVGLSVVIALVAATAALWLAVNLTGVTKMLMSSVVMAVAVCGMHYTGMAAMEMTLPQQTDMTASLKALESGMAPMTMGLFVFCTSMILLVLCLVAALNQLNSKMEEELLLETS